MSRQLRLLSPPLASLGRSVPRTTQTSRKNLHTLRQQHQQQHQTCVSYTPCRSAHTLRAARQDSSRDEESQYYADGMEEHDYDSSSLPTGSSSSTRSANRLSRGGNTEHLTEHLNGLFPGLRFPPELAKRILTHASHPTAVDGHNGGFRFMGRRVLESYLSLFLTTSPSLQPSYDLEQISNRTLNTYILGEHIGSSWGLGRVMRWTPTVKAENWKRASSATDGEADGTGVKLSLGGEEKAQLVKEIGLYKVQGDAVAAVVGGVFHQFGGSTAHRLFHTRILPNLLLPGQPIGLLDAFHAEAEEVCRSMGGTEGRLSPLVGGSGSSPTKKVEARA